MAQGEYKVGQAIEVTYQATKAETGLDDVKMEVYDEGHALDEVKTVDAMTEIGATGRYYAAFTPDAEGEWQVHIDSATKKGKVIKQFSVVAHNIDSVGDAVATADGKIDALENVSKAEVNTEVDAALADYDAPTKAELDAVVAETDGKIDALTDIDAAAVNAEVDIALSDYDVAKASDIVSPPMVG